MASTVFDAVVEALKADFDEATANRVLNCLVKTCGGERVYIPVKMELQAPISANDTPKTIQAKLGCSRRTAYNRLSRHRI